MQSFSITNNKENTKTHTCNHLHSDSRYTYAHTNINIYESYILTKYRARESFTMNSFLFNTINKSFHDRIISLVQ